MSRTFDFASTWVLPAPPEDVFTALAAVDLYPQWWPQVRAVARLSESAALVVIRSALPYSLELIVHREVEDAATGTLRVGISGDLTGYSAFHVAPHPGPWGARHTEARFTESVEVSAAVLGRVAGVLGPLLRANHAAMMRAGQVGLKAHLAGSS